MLKMYIVRCLSHEKIIYIIFPQIRDGILCNGIIGYIDTWILFIYIYEAIIQKLLKS